MRFRAGDVLLLHGVREAMPEAFAALGCLPLAERPIGLERRGARLTTPLLFGAAILLVVSGLAPPQVAVVAAAAGLVLLRESNPREL